MVTNATVRAFILKFSFHDSADLFKTSWKLHTSWLVSKYSIINQARGRYWETKSARGHDSMDRAARSVQRRPRADFSPVRSLQACWIREVFTRLKLPENPEEWYYGIIRDSARSNIYLEKYWSGKRAIIGPLNYIVV